MSERTFLEVRGVTHGVLADVDLVAGRGALVALTGHSGSGKSTLCHLIAGFERPTKGTVSLEGRATADIADWSVISAVPQRLALLEELTALESLTLPALACGQPFEPLPARELLTELGVGPLIDRPVGLGSIGEQQRIAVARALFLGSALVVLDEPTAHQDDDSAELVIRAIMAAVDAGALVVTSTHDPRLLRPSTATLALGSG